MLPFVLRSFSLGDVTGDLRGADHPPALAQNRRDGQRDGDERAVLSTANRFVMVDAVAAPDAGEDFVLLVLAVIRNDETNGLAHHLGRRKPDHGLGRRIP